jgi:CRISPR-associated endonuclease/helicase Cas3
LERNKLLEYMPTKFRNGRIRDSKWYFMLIYIFSLLIDTDKFDSARIKPYDPKLIHYERVTEYLKLKRKNDTKSALNDKREKARLSMLQVINNLTDEEIKNTYFFTLTAPTGIGKTLSSLQCALYLQNRIKEIEGYNPKIIVAIPFINIIEQNKLEYQNVFKDDVRMIAHYSLSDFTSNVSLNENTPLDKALMLTESWDGDVILTTFVQLFQSIFTGGNRPLKKINKLAGSIVILDEVQSLPQEYMPLIGATLQLLAKYYGTKFILMTATQPKILEFGKMLLSNDKIDIENEEIQLLPDYESYFMELSRTKFVPILDKVLDNEEFIELFFKKWPTDKSALVVANTIKKSIEIYEGIKRKLQEKKLNVPVYYLSTNIIPLKRKEVIFEVRSLLEKNEPVILVSTQTIEAGVDLDFDMAFRDFAPIDSLIQTAGRVNRSGRKGNYLPVYIVQLGNDNQYVYGLSHRKHTEYLLKGKNEILENEYGKLAEEYYQLALNDGVDDKSIEIWDGMMKLDFEAVEKFRLIKNIEEVCDVFVEINEFASSLADAFEKVLSYDGQSNFDYDLSNVLGENYASKFNGKLSPFEIKAILRLIKAKMNDFIIQVRISRMLENKPLEFKVRGEVQCDLYWIPPEDVSRYYDENTGFIDKSGKALIY